MIRWPKTELPDSDHEVAEVGPCKRKRDYRKRPWAEIGKETYFFTYVPQLDTSAVGPKHVCPASNPPDIKAFLCFAP